MRGSGPDRVLTVPNAISLTRLVLIGLFGYLLLATQADTAAAVVLITGGASDWADGKLARLLGQSSKLGAVLDPAIDRLYLAAVPIVFGLRGLVPWWVVGILLGRDLLLAALLPVLRNRGLIALPVTYIGKAGTFALMSAFPLLLLGQSNMPAARAALACGWAFLIWGLGMYLWSFAQYLTQTVLLLRQLPKVTA